jgi:hypothetical protein
MKSDQALEAAATVLVVAAVWKVGDMDVAGQWLMLAGNVAWLAWAVWKRCPWMAVQNAVLAILTVRAIHHWNFMAG